MTFPLKGLPLKGPAGALVATLQEWRPRAPCYLAALVPVLGLLGCDSGGVECQCQPTGLLLQICPQLSDQVKTVELFDNACTGASMALVDGGSDAVGTVSYDIQPTQAGMCSVEVTFTNGLTFAADQSSGLVVTSGPACCPGLYPEGAREIQACVDAGALDAEAPSDGPSGS
jgi:hypothetical protein